MLMDNYLGAIDEKHRQIDNFWLLETTKNVTRRQLLAPPSRLVFSTTHCRWRSPHLAPRWR
jgi:hypothetical protein